MNSGKNAFAHLFKFLNKYEFECIQPTHPSFLKSDRFYVWKKFAMMLRKEREDDRPG